MTLPSWRVLQQLVQSDSLLAAAVDSLHKAAMLLLISSQEVRYHLDKDAIMKTGDDCMVTNLTEP